MDFSERYQKEQQFIQAVMTTVYQDPSCVEGLLNLVASSFTEEELEQEINLWIN